MGWLVQGEAPPGALFQKFRSATSCKALLLWHLPETSSAENTCNPKLSKYICVFSVRCMVTRSPPKFDFERI